MTDLVSRYAGTCAECGEHFPQGEAIVSGEHGWQHSTCPDDPTEHKRQVCGGCFTEVSVSGRCMCHA